MELGPVGGPTIGCKRTPLLSVDRKSEDSCLTSGNRELVPLRAVQRPETVGKEGTRNTANE